MKKYLPALVAGFGAGVLLVVPIIKSFSCCLIVPAASVFALLLDQKANRSTNRIDTSQALIFGLVTGLFAALFGTFFELLITFVTKSNDLIFAYNDLIEFINEFPVTDDIKQEVVNMSQNVVTSIKTTGFSALYSIAIFINNIIVDPIFGMIGGLIGAKFINNRLNQPD